MESAFVKHIFKQGFILDEERLRKIGNIIRSRVVQADPQAVIEFTVYRSDSIYYTTADIDSVFAEDNSQYKRITEIRIQCSKKKAFDFRLSFDEDGTKLSIQGTGRDFVYLLFSDLREYIQSEVNIIKAPRFLHAKEHSEVIIIAMLFLTLSLILIASVPSSSFKSTPSEDEISSALSSPDISKKLDFLIRHNKAKQQIDIVFSEPLRLVLFIILAALAVSSKLIIRFFAKLYPKNVFAIGKAVEEYDRILTLRNRIFWGFFVAFAASLIASLVIYFSTR